MKKSLLNHHCIFQGYLKLSTKYINPNLCNQDQNYPNLLQDYICLEGNHYQQIFDWFSNQIINLELVHLINFAYLMILNGSESSSNIHFPHNPMLQQLHQRSKLPFFKIILNLYYILRI